jgi:HEAT repeat protein
MRVLVATGTILCVLLVALSASHAGEPGDLAPLIEAIRQGDKEARVDALWELGFMEDEGKPAVAAILPLLRDKDAEIRSAAITALQRIGLGPESLPAVVDALADTEVGSYAAQALAALGSSAVPVLVKALENRSSEARANAVLALTLMGPKARDAVPALLAAFKRESPENREGGRPRAHRGPRRR